MKKYLLLILSPSFIMLCHINAKAQTSKKRSTNSSSISALNGAWETTWQDSGSNVSRKEFSVLHDGFFSNVSQDSTGAWQETHAGTYEITGNVYKQKLLYSSHPDRMDVTHWIDFRLNGDTLYLNFFKKVIGSKGEDLNPQNQRFEQKYVRAKKSPM